MSNFEVSNSVLVAPFIPAQEEIIPGQQMGTKLYNKLSSYIKELDNCRAFKRELKSFLLRHAFCSVDEFISM